MNHSKTTSLVMRAAIEVNRRGFVRMQEANSKVDQYMHTLVLGLVGIPSLDYSSLQVLLDIGIEF